MITVQSRSNVTDIIRMYKDDYPTKLTKVLNYALEDTAKEMWRENRIELRRAFDNPRPYTLNGFYVLKPYYVGFLKAGIASREFSGKGTPAYRYLRPNVDGGGRSDKSSEKSLKTRGILPDNSQTAMGGAYPKDQYGDIAGARYGQMLADLDSYPKIGGGIQYSNRKRKEKREASGNHFFLFTPKGASEPIGIAERRGKNVVVMLRFIRPGQYKQRYKFYDVAQKTAEMQFPVQFNKAFGKVFGR